MAMLAKKNMIVCMHVCETGTCDKHMCVCVCVREFKCQQRKKKVTMPSQQHSFSKLNIF